MNDSYLPRDLPIGEMRLYRDAMPMIDWAESYAERLRSGLPVVDIVRFDALCMADVRSVLEYMLIATDDRDRPSPP